MPSPTIRRSRRRKKVSKTQLVSYLLEHDVSLTFTAEELAKLPIHVLLTEKIHVQTVQDAERILTPQEITAIEFILAQPDNFLSRSDLQAMCAADLLDEEKRLQKKMRSRIVLKHLVPNFNRV